MHVIYHMSKAMSSPLLRLPFVQQRSGKYTNTLEVGHLKGRKRVDVYRRSPALGSRVERKRPSGLISTEPAQRIRQAYSAEHDRRLV
jgi:hypothetical protein